MLFVYRSLDFSRLDATFWDQFQKSSCLPDSCPCEAFSDGIFMQPTLVATSVPGLLIGLYIMWKFRWRLKGLGLSFVLTALGSILLHASITHIGQIADFSGIALIFLWVLLHITVKGNRRMFTLFVSLSIAVYILFINYIQTRYYVVFAIIILQAIFIPIKKPGFFFNHKRVSIVSVVFLFIGFILFRLDLNRVFCPDITIFQGHSLWHMCVTVSQLLLTRNLYLEEINLQEVS